MTKNKNSKIQFAYDLDAILNYFDKSSLVCQDFDDSQIEGMVEKLFKVVKSIEPKTTEHSEQWFFWVQLLSGSFEDYMEKVAVEEELEDDEIQECEKELQYDWEYKYPEQVKWYRLSLSRNYEGKELCLSFGPYFIMFEHEKKNLRGYDHLDQQKMLLSFIQMRLEHIVAAIVANASSYYDTLEKTLSKRYRFGRLKRNFLWEACDDVERLDQKLGKNKIQQFAKLVPCLEEGGFIEKMTANDFFRYCEIGYDANQYKHLTGTPVEKYKRKADMRDEGLTQIDGDSEQAFYEWYHDRNRRGGHPWEICSGGNTTHISLYVMEERKNNKWRLILAGSSRARVVETIKMALALHSQGIPVQLSDAEALYNMVKGQDLIGIVPHDVTPKYCHSCFPEEDEIIDFMNLWYEESVMKKVQDKIYWYPLEKYMPIRKRSKF